MRSFGFEVKSREGDSKIPLAVAGQVMVDVQKVLTEIISSVLRTELLIQGDIPKNLLSKYELTIGGNTPSGLGSDSSPEGRPLLEASLDAFCGTLDFVGKGIVNPWIVSNYPETLGRRKLCEALLNLSDHIDGYVMKYGENGCNRSFTGVNREKMLTQIEEDSATHRNASRLGVILGDPRKKNLYLYDGAVRIPIHLGNTNPDSVANHVSNGVVIVRGTGEFDVNGNLESIKNISNITPIDTITYKRIISDNFDIELACPLPAAVSVSSDGKKWTFKNADLGIDVSKNDWDSATLAFHEYVEFLWKEYVETDSELEGEELEIAELLKSYAPLY